MRTIKGFEDYSVTKDGQVYSHFTNKFIKPFLRESTYKYLYVNLYNNGKKSKHSIHRLVAKAYIPNNNNKPQVNHINGEKFDNRSINLEWATASENGLHAYHNGLSKVSDYHKKCLVERQNKIVLDTSNGVYYESAKQASKYYNIKATTLMGYMRGERKNKTSLIYV
jgi:hypothetical protein